MTWTVSSLLVLGAALAAGFWWYERTSPTARVLAIVAALAALAALGRIAFAPLPNVTPTTGIVLLTGFALGAAPGFAVGAVGAVASNAFFGQGPWTPWQMAAWGLVGLAGAALAAVAGGRGGRAGLAAAGAAAALGYGAVMNLSLWVLYSGDHTAAKLGAYYATSLPFDLAHAAGSAAFCVALGPALVAALTRLKVRSTIAWGPVTGAAALAAVLALGAGAAPPSASAAVPKSSVRYVLGAQNRDGGFPAAPGAASTHMHTGWAALGLAAAGRNPADTGAVGYIREHAGSLRGDVGELTRTILVLEAAGVSPRAFAGRNLVGELLARRSGDGSWAGRVNSTAFGILALRATGRPAGRGPVARARRWLTAQANPDGGFNFGGEGGPSGIDETAAALQALAAAKRVRSGAARRAAGWLVRRQNRDGGFPLQPGGASNAQSTSWAVQALVAVGRDPGRVRRDGSRSPLGYLRSLRQDDGAIRYSRTSAQTPVWVTAQALAALAREPFPLGRVPRRASGARTATADPGHAGEAADEPPPAAPEVTPQPVATTAAPAGGRARDRPAARGPLGPGVPPELAIGLRARAAGFVAGVALSPVV